MSESSQNEGLNFLDQLRRYWTIIASVVAVGVGMQVQINKNATNIENLMKFRDRIEPNELETITSIQSIEGDLKFIRKQVEINGYKIEKLDTEFGDYKDETSRNIQEFYRRNPDL